VAGRCDFGKEPAVDCVWRGVDWVSVRLLPFREKHVVYSLYWSTNDGRDSVALWRPARACAIGGSNPYRDKVSIARPDQPQGPLNHLYNWYRVFPGSKAAGLRSLTRPRASDHTPAALLQNASEIHVPPPTLCDSIGISPGDLTFTLMRMAPVSMSGWSSHCATVSTKPSGTPSFGIWYTWRSVISRYNLFGFRR